MDKKIVVIAVVAGIAIIAGGSFYAGTKYRQNRNPVSAFNRNTGGQEGTRAGGAGFVSGEIISKDDKSVTVKIPVRQNSAGQNIAGQDGGSKIVLFSDSTQIMKSVAGSTSDLKVGENITVSGAANQDGSVTAQTIQLRTATSAP
jgi:hypothetical protein